MASASSIYPMIGGTTYCDSILSVLYGIGNAVVDNQRHPASYKDEIFLEEGSSGTPLNRHVPVKISLTYISNPKMQQPDLCGRGAALSFLVPPTRVRPMQR